MAVTYDATTENGIEYVSSLYTSKSRYRDVVDELDILKPGRDDALAGKGAVTQYAIGSRSLSRSNLSAKDLLARYDHLMSEKYRLEAGRSARKAVGVVLRDW